MKVFTCDHDGKFIFGISVVVASSKRAALTLLRKELLERKLGASKEEIDMVEIDITKPGVTVLFDGVY